MSNLQAIRLEGGIVPPTLFQHIQAGAIGDPASRSAASYHLPGKESIRDAANRSWTYLTGAWEAWREAQAREPGGMSSTSAAAVRERWLLVLLQELGYGRLPAHTGGVHVEDHHYPVSHPWQHVPIHLLGPGVDLDRRNPGVQGATRAPQAMVQELLNRTDEHLWAIVSNGLRLRLLRDSTALAGSAFIEFDLEAIFDGELFAEFLLLWQTCHQSRLEARAVDGGEPSITECWLELWRADSVKAGARALEKLRAGVEDALTHLGTGFLAHPANSALRADLSSGAMRPEDYHRHLLRLVYRLLFLFVTEDRGVLLDPAAHATARQRYTDYLSTQRLRTQARQRQGSASYADLWQAQRLVLRALGGDGQADLALPALGGLFDPEDGQGEPLLDAELANDAFLAAVRDLAWLPTTGQRLQPVDYRNLGAEELGSVYEALLELVPRVSVEDHRFALEHLSGNERKTTGSYYTPPGLVSALLDTALDPVLDDAVAGARTAQEAEQRLLALTVCDPACGSGHFIVAAARRIAQRLASVRSGEDEPTPADVRHALRDVVGRCVYGVDLNPLAAELAKVSLWLEAVEPGKALGFLDARIRVGNSLLGTTPALLAAGVPDEAFKPLEGDDRQVATAVRKRNSAERGAYGHGQDQLDLELDATPTHTLARTRAALLQPQDDAASVRALARRWRDYEHSPDYLDHKAHADAWAAAFVWPLVPAPARTVDAETPRPVQPPTSAIVRRLGSEPHATTLAPVRAEVERLADEYRFFHWHLEFPEVFERSGRGADSAGDTGGFDAVVGNPPWDKVKLEDKEFFASRDGALASVGTSAKRQRLIQELKQSDPALFHDYVEARRRSAGISHYIRKSGTFPLTGRGDVDVYGPFAELANRLRSSRGRAGVLVKTGIALDAVNQYYFSSLVEGRTLIRLHDFRNKGFFPGAASSQGMRFCILVTGSLDRDHEIDLAFELHSLAESTDPRRKILLTPDDFAQLNPNTKSCPVFRSQRDATITLAAHLLHPVLRRESGGNSWDVAFLRMFDMSTDSDYFIGRGDVDFREDLAPLLEGKMVHHYNHRFGDYRDVQLVAGKEVRSIPSPELAELMSPDFRTTARHYVEPRHVRERDHVLGNRTYALAFRDVASAPDERTLIACLIPRYAVGHTAPIAVSRDDTTLVGILSSFALDFIARQKIGGTHMTYTTFKQLPVPAYDLVLEPAQWDSRTTLASWIGARVRELSLCTYEFAEEPFTWDTSRRAHLRAELDAGAFHLYGIDRDDVDYILETFPIVKRKDVAAHGEYRTKRLILEVYDAMQKAIDTGTEYQTILDPPPGKGPRHPASTQPSGTSRGTP